MALGSLSGTHLGFSWVTFGSLGWANMGIFGLKLQSVALFLEAPASVSGYGSGKCRTKQVGASSDGFGFRFVTEI